MHEQNRTKLPPPTWSSTIPRLPRRAKNEYSPTLKIVAPPFMLITSGVYLFLNFTVINAAVKVLENWLLINAFIHLSLIKIK